MTKPDEDKSIKSGSRRAIAITAAMVALLCFAAIKISSSVSQQIIQSNISSMEEIALHDRRSIQSSLDIRWSEMESIARRLQSQRFLDDADVSEKLRDVAAYVTSAEFLMLISEDGTEYRSTGLISANAELNRVLEGRSERFASRYNEGRSRWKESNKEMLVMGVPIDLAGPGVHFRWLMCRLSISTLESELKIDSYQSQGFSSVIDREGNYIINISRSHNIGTYDNFYEDLAGASFEGYSSIEALRAAVAAGGASSIVYREEGGQENIMVVTGMDFVDWHFITTVPMRVFDAQTNSIMTSFLVLITAASVVFAIVFILFARHKKQNERLQLAEAESRAKTAFLFNMSHDIRTPMNAILGFTDIAMSHMDETARVADSLAKIKSSSSLLLGLINDILEMSRIEAGKLDIAEEPVDMLRVGDNINPMIESLAREKDIRYSYSVEGVADRYVYADVQHINRVLVNLLTNAVKYTHRGGRVFFVTAQEGEAKDGEAAYRFVVADTGVGMPKAFLENHLYQQFSREQTSTLSKQQGTGLGLAIAKRIVDALGGEIAVESEVGKGTTFTVRLSLKLQSAEDMAGGASAQEGPEEAKQESTLVGKKALLVEDNELNREIGVAILEEAGIAVDTAEDGSLALRALEEKGMDYYDFVLMDIQMPVMDGYEATRRIRRLPGGGRIKIIAVSANAFTEDRRKSKEAGMNDHIAKPIDMEELMAALRKHIGNPV